VCVITGAASGIGAETTRLFSAEGAIVVGVDRQPGSDGALTLQADVTDEQQVLAMYARAREELVISTSCSTTPGSTPPMTRPCRHTRSTRGNGSRT